MNYIRSTGGLALALWIAAFATCSNDDRAGLLGDQNDLPQPGRTDAGQTDEPDASTSEPDASVDPGDGGPPDGTVVNCGAVACRGAGKCVIVDDQPTCECDEGYTLLAGSCVVDETCVKLRLIEPSCRQRVGNQPALAMAFNVETCAGTTVLPEILGDVSQAFKVLEDGNDLGDESYATVFDRGVESWVAIALDMSSSVASNQGLLDSLIDLVEGIIDDLAPAEGEPPVRVEIIVFGRSIAVLVPFTADLEQVRGALEALRADPGAAVTEPDGTNLHGVVNLGIESLAGALEARVEETGGAVVSTGTLITITDGRDTGGVRLEPIPSRFNVISIGVSGNINDAELTRIGPQGSFLAPEQGDREVAFSTVAQRVKEYPNRAYLLAYCSPAVAGNHEVVATLAHREAAASATCSFNASEFGSGSACNETFILTYCEAASDGCGGFLACNPACSGPDAGPVSKDWTFSD